MCIGPSKRHYFLLHVAGESGQKRLHINPARNAPVKLDVILSKGKSYIDLELRYHNAYDAAGL